MRPPSTESVVEAIESTSGETVVASSAAKANALGLTTQVSAREVYLTSGPSRRLKLGNREIGLKHGNQSLPSLLLILLDGSRAKPSPVSEAFKKVNGMARILNGLQPRSIEARADGNFSPAVIGPVTSPCQ